MLDFGTEKTAANIFSRFQVAKCVFSSQGTSFMAAVHDPVERRDMNPCGIMFFFEVVSRPLSFYCRAQHRHPTRIAPEHFKGRWVAGIVVVVVELFSLYINFRFYFDTLAYMLPQSALLPLPVTLHFFNVGARMSRPRSSCVNKQ